MGQNTDNTILDVKDLKVSFYTDNGEVPAVRGVTFDLRKGESLGIVGESGCGKSATVSAIMRLLPIPPAKIKDGTIMYEGVDIAKTPEREMLRIRGAKIAMIFQEPMTALNPVMTVGSQIAEAILQHNKISKTEANQKAVELLKLVEIPEAEKRAASYPHQLSGGMRQRVMIAMALSCQPEILIADEPTTALDVTIQAQILDLLRKMRKETGTSILLITHDLGVIAEMCERVIVMYSGRIVEKGDIIPIFEHPMHPYTEGLFNSIPRMDQDVEELHVIKGRVSDPLDPPSGCWFHPRCPYCRDKCKEIEPELRTMQDGREVACHFAEEVGTHGE